MELQNKINMEADVIRLSVNGQTFTVTLERNSSSIALLEQLTKGNITVNMEDYAQMEKVGELGVRLPRNDRPIKTSPGDIILYQGHYLVIYYDRNSYMLTRLGRINDVTPEELKNILGRDNVIVTLSLKE